MSKKPIDWEGIKTDYTTGDMSIRDLARWHRVSEAAVRKRAKAEGWTRIEGAPGAPVKKREIAVTYRVEQTPATTETTDPAQIVDRGRNLALRMLDELNATTSSLGELETFIAEATEGDESQRRVEAMMRAISLPSRAATLRALAQAAKTLAETSTAAAPQGKKAEKQAAAARVGGKFGVRQPPNLSLVKG
ncbi:hypothetical protein ACP4J4_01780 [Aureimonas ureilytica]|uniref:hypothetical protein n=1 Tax=Aureimonas ureilytica TaxID=401562 RepID=UPI003CF8897A